MFTGEPGARGHVINTCVIAAAAHALSTSLPLLAAATEREDQSDPRRKSRAFLSSSRRLPESAAALFQWQRG